jgi:putative addiction module component (TIGR02574 family)
MRPSGFVSTLASETTRSPFEWVNDPQSLWSEKTTSFSSDLEAYAGIDLIRDALFITAWDDKLRADYSMKSSRATLDLISEPDVEAAWSAEIERRLVEIDADAVELISWEDVRSELFGEWIIALESETGETLEAAALQLTPTERVPLVDRLIVTLDADPEVEEAWATEVERRQTEIENGKVSLLPGPETLTKLKAAFQW